MSTGLPERQRFEVPQIRRQAPWQLIAAADDVVFRHRDHQFEAAARHPSHSMLIPIADLYAGRANSPAGARLSRCASSRGETGARAVQRQRRQRDDDAARVRRAARARDRQAGLRVVGLQIEGVCRGRR